MVPGRFTGQTGHRKQTIDHRSHRSSAKNVKYLWGNGVGGGREEREGTACCCRCCIAHRTDTRTDVFVSGGVCLFFLKPYKPFYVTDYSYSQYLLYV